MSSDEPELLRQFRHIAQFKSRARRARHLVGVFAAGLFVGAIAAGAVMGSVMIALEYAPPDPPGTILLAKITTADDGLFVIDVRVKFQDAQECLTARSAMLASERIMFECVAR